MINEKFESFQKNKNLEFSHKNLKENLKIVVENNNFSVNGENEEETTDANHKGESSELLDYDDIAMEEEEELNSTKNISLIQPKILEAQN